MDTVGFVCGGLTFIVAICIGSYFAHRQMKANLDAWRESAKNWKKISATWKEEYYQQRKYADTMQREILK
ncbi:hypothetical protein L9G16_22565, partial [Shewanella sp. A25]|nr:hypothetical protein [Shewanella shenzhenensis]